MKGEATGIIYKDIYTHLEACIQDNQNFEDGYNFLFAYGMFACGLKEQGRDYLNKVTNKLLKMMLEIHLPVVENNVKRYNRTKHDLFKLKDN